MAGSGSGFGSVVGSPNGSASGFAGGGSPNGSASGLAGSGSGFGSVVGSPNGSASGFTGGGPPNGSALPPSSVAASPSSPGPGNDLVTALMMELKGLPPSPSFSAGSTAGSSLPPNGSPPSSGIGLGVFPNGSSDGSVVGSVGSSVPLGVVGVPKGSVSTVVVGGSEGVPAPKGSASDAVLESAVAGGVVAGAPDSATPSNGVPPLSISVSGTFGCSLSVSAGDALRITRPWASRNSPYLASLIASRFARAVSFARRRCFSSVSLETP